MIIKTLTRAQWERKLRALHCEPLEGKGRLNTAEWWKDRDGYPFTVPVQNAGGDCDFWAIQRICRDLGDEACANWSDNDC